MELERHIKKNGTNHNQRSLIMNLYGLINPSDTITFRALNDKIAFFCSVAVGGGNLGCENIDTENSIPSILIFQDDAEKFCEEYLGMDFKTFLENNIHHVAESFLSFAYVSPSKRAEFDLKYDSFDDAEREKHEDQRTSMNRLVHKAWQLGNRFKTKIES